MSDTRKQKKNKRWAQTFDEWFGKNTQGARQIRRANRRTEERKRKQFRRAS